MFLLMDSETCGRVVLGLRDEAGPGTSGSLLPSYPPRLDILEDPDLTEAEAADLREWEALPDEEVPPEDEPA